MATSDGLRRGREADEQATRCAAAAECLCGGAGMEGALKRALEVEVESLLRYAGELGYRRLRVAPVVSRAALDAADTEAMRLEELDAAPARRDATDEARNGEEQSNG